MKVWDDTGHEIFATAPDTVTILHVRLSDDNKYIGILSQNQEVKIYSLKEGFLLELNTTTNRINDKYLFDFTRRDMYLPAMVNENTVNLYDRKGDLFQKLGNQSGRVNALDIL